jgi:hypothetical protein
MLMQGAEQKGRSSRRGSFSKLSHPATIDSATNVSEAKLMTLRRGRRQASSQEREAPTQGDKENIVQATEHCEENVMQSPTPYWKVALERGISPTETRSAKKKKKKVENRKEDKASSVRALDFAPPGKDKKSAELL